MRNIFPSCSAMLLLMATVSCDTEVTNPGPVQVLMAEGFGTTTVTPAQTARGRGSWKDGKWTVTLARPLHPGAELGDLEPGKRGYLAFAIWDGDKQNSGSRKMRSGWVPFRLEEK